QHPEAPGDTGPAAVADDLRAFFGAAAVYALAYLPGALPRPVDAEPEAVIEGAEFAGGAGGQLQHGGAAEAPMGDEQCPRRGMGHILRLYGGLWDGDPGEGVEPAHGNVKSKQGGHGWYDVVPETTQEAPGGRTAAR